MKFILLTTLHDSGAVLLTRDVLDELSVPIDVRPRRAEAQFSLVAIEEFDILVPEDRLAEAREALEHLSEDAEATLPESAEAAPRGLAQRQRSFLIALALLIALAALLLLSVSR